MVKEQRIVEYFLEKVIEMNKAADNAKNKKQYEMASSNITLLNEIWDVLNQE